MIKKLLAGAALTGIDPVRTLRAATGTPVNPPFAADLNYSPVTAAHIEQTGTPRTIFDLYSNHAESARLIHNHMADKTSQADISVDLLNLSAIKPSSKELEAMNTIDVFSVSQGMNQISMGIGGQTDEYEKHWKSNDAIGVYSAGNQGDTKITVPKQSMSDFGDTAITVGEAEKKADGTWQVKDHSQRVGAVSLVAPNITDQGFGIPIIKSEVDLTGHEDLVRETETWLNAREALTQNNASATFTDAALIAKRDELLADPKYIEQLDNRISHYMTKDASEFHQKIHDNFSSNFTKNAEGLAVNVDGTSFCSPYVAGVFSAAKFESKMREQQGQPALSSEEIVALSYLSCDPVSQVENGKDSENKANGRGIISNNRAGFGLFTAEKFAEQQRQAYAVLDKNPQLQTIAESISADNFTPEKDGTGGYTITIPETNDITVFKTRIEYHSENIPPVMLKFTSPQGHEQFIDMSQAADYKQGSDDYHLSWGNSEQFFGESSAGDWKIEPIYDTKQGEPSKWDINPTDLKITIQGAQKGGLIDKMIDKQLGLEQEINHKIENTPPSLPPKNRGGGRGF